MFDDDDRRYLWQIELSPDEKSVVVLETESESLSGPRVLKINLATREKPVVFQGLAAPIGWSGDGEWVYLITEAERTPEAVANPARIIRVPATATASGDSGDSVVELAKLPVRGGMWSAVDITPDGKWLIYDGEQFVSDIWMANGFDRDMVRP